METPSSYEIGLPKESLDTPALLLDLDVFWTNACKIGETCRKAGISWRPHTKAIKVPAIAHRLLEAGAVGITCAKLGEAEVMAAARSVAARLMMQRLRAERDAERLPNIREPRQPCVSPRHAFSTWQPICRKV